MNSGMHLITPEAITAADTGYQKLLGSYTRLAEAAKGSNDAELDFNHPIVQQFVEAMDDDFNTAKALAVLYELSTETNTALAASSPDRMPPTLACAA